MSTPKRKLLLIACSNRKKRDKGLMPALERYDGVNYLVIKKLMREIHMLLPSKITNTFQH